MDDIEIAQTIYAAAFGAEFVRATAAGESFPHDKAEMKASAARAAYHRITDAREALRGAR